MKRILIIGGTSGIGLSYLQLAKKEGYQLELYSRCPGNLELGNGISHQEFNVLESDFSLLTNGPEIDGFVYFPGSISLKPFHRFSEEDVIQDFQINALAALKSIQAIRKRLTKHSSIVLFSTVAVKKGMSFHSSIAMAKGAVEGLTRSLSAELAPNTRVNCIAPSLTDTPLAAQLLSKEEKQEAAKQRHPLKQYGSPNDIAALVQYLISDQSKFMTGQILGIDGGLSAI